MFDEKGVISSLFIIWFDPSSLPSTTNQQSQQKHDKNDEEDPLISPQDEEEIELLLANLSDEEN